MNTISINTPEFRMNSPEMQRARSESWWAETEWGVAVLSYEDNAALMKDSRLIQGSTQWPQHHGVTQGPYVDWWLNNLLVLEGDDHHRIRRIVNPVFAPRNINKYFDDFELLANELIDNWISNSKIEFASDFAAPYSSRILCMILGIPQQEWTKVYDLAASIGLGIGVEVGIRIDEINNATQELIRFARELIISRRSRPRQDMISDLVMSSDSDPDRLSEEELVNLLVLIIFAGIDTTRNQLGLAIDSFSRQPDQWELLASNPEQYGQAAAEEALRLNPVARWVTREATETFTHKDLRIEAGTTVHMFTQSSGTDPAEFPSAPNLIDLKADRSPHFAFGGGLHHCLGHYVARSDLRIALSSLAGRIRNIDVLPGAEWLPDSGNTGPVVLPISFTIR